MARSEFAIVGAGALGSILAAHLVRSGRSVTLLARGRRAQQVQEQGLRVKGLSEIATPVQILTDPAQPYRLARVEQVCLLGRLREPVVDDASADLALLIRS